jgi:hypothetical protein
MTAVQLYEVFRNILEGDSFGIKVIKDFSEEEQLNILYPIENGFRLSVIKHEYGHDFALHKNHEDALIFLANFVMDWYLTACEEDVQKLIEKACVNKDYKKVVDLYNDNNEDGDHLYVDLVSLPIKPEEPHIPNYEKYTVAELEALPDIIVGQANSLKVEENNTRWWLSRVSDINPIDVEVFKNGEWQVVHNYGS